MKSWQLFVGVAGVALSCSGAWESDWHAGFPGLVASLSIRDGTSNTTSLVVEASILSFNFSDGSVR